jgi:hypothetical protein
MRGDAWKRKDDSEFIRQVTYFLRNLQVECQRFGIWGIGIGGHSSIGFKNIPDNVIWITNVAVNPEGFYFRLRHREFQICQTCGEVLESSIFEIGHGVCWRCEPEKYAIEGD